MNRRILVTRPNWDRTTRYLSAWAKKAIELAETKGDGVLDLEKDKANIQLLESMLNRHSPSFVFFNGHGDEECICGQDNKELISVNKNEGILKSTIIYALSCSAGKILGHKIVESGARAYIGYSGVFTFLFDQNQRTNPAQDKIAEVFLEPANQVAVSLIKGRTVVEAHLNSRRAFFKRILKLISSESKPAESIAVRYLLWDMQYQVCLGDQGAKI